MNVFRLACVRFLDNASIYLSIVSAEHGIAKHRTTVERHSLNGIWVSSVHSNGNAPFMNLKQAAPLLEILLVHGYIPS